MKLTQQKHPKTGTYSISVSLNPNGESEKVPTTAFIPFPPDTRKRVEDPAKFPFSPIGQVIMTFPNGITYSGTGTLIQETYVLTCAHNLYSTEDGGYAKSVSFIPARNGRDIMPYGEFRPKKFTVPEEYTRLNLGNPHAMAGFVSDHSGYFYDYGLIQLSKPVEQAGSLDMYAATKAQLKDLQVNITGYPGDKKPEDTMWGADGALMPGADDELLYYTISTFKGESGSGVTSLLPKIAPESQPKIVGIHVAGSLSIKRNFAVRLTREIISRIKSWM